MKIEEAARHKVLVDAGPVRPSALVLELGATDCLLVACWLWLLIAVGQAQLACCLALLLTSPKPPKVPRF